MNISAPSRTMKIIAVVSAVWRRLSAIATVPSVPVSSPIASTADHADRRALGRREHAAIDAADHGERDQQHRPCPDQRAASLGAATACGPAGPAAGSRRTSQAMTPM